MFKKCTRCKEYHMLGNFGVNKEGKLQLQSWCRYCQRQYLKNYASQPEIRIKVLREAREYGRNNKLRRRDRDLKNKYGISLEQYNDILNLQGGGCKLCGNKMKKDALNTDHCHETGRIRGILCWMCNTALGTLGDNIVGLEKAMKYLKGEL